MIWPANKPRRRFVCVSSLSRYSPRSCLLECSSLHRAELELVPRIRKSEASVSQSEATAYPNTKIPR